MKTNLVATAMCLASIMALPVQATDPLASSDMSVYGHSRFAVKTERLSDGVYLMRRVASWRSFVQANVTVIINDHDVVVVDSGNTAYTKNIVAEIKKLTDKPISTVITTHWHGDHNRGNHIYRQHYPGVQIISHFKTRENMWHRDKSLAEPRDSEAIQKEKLEMAELIAKGEKDNMPTEILASWRDYLAGIDELYDDLDKAQSGIADITFDDKMILHRGARRIEILHLGRANTDGDAVIWLPQEKIAVTGDIVVRPTPYGFYSYPGEWADTIEQIKQLGFEILVPGHGPATQSSEYLDQLIYLFRDLTKQTRAAVDGGAETMDDLKDVVDFSVHSKAIAGDDPLFQRLFKNWFTSPILDSALKEAKGEAIPQYETED